MVANLEQDEQETETETQRKTLINKRIHLNILYFLHLRNFNNNN